MNSLHVALNEIFLSCVKSSANCNWAVNEVRESVGVTLSTRFAVATIFRRVTFEDGFTSRSNDCSTFRILRFQSGNLEMAELLG